MPNPIMNRIANNQSKEVFQKVFKDAILNVVVYGLGAIVIAFVTSYLGWRTIGLMLGGIFALIVLLSLVPFIISFIAGLIAIPLTVKEALGGNTDAGHMQKYLWAGTIIQLVENTICVLYALYLYNLFFNAIG